MYNNNSHGKEAREKQQSNEVKTDKPNQDRNSSLHHCGAPSEHVFTHLIRDVGNPSSEHILLLHSKHSADTDRVMLLV